MKRFISIPIFILILSSAVHSGIFVDFNLAHTRTGDLENQLGFGGTLGYSFNNNVGVFVRSIINSTTEDPNTVEEIDYEYWMTLAGIHYRMPIQGGPIFWTSSLGLGMASGDIDVDATGQHISDTGPVIAVWTGFLVEATQRISLYLEAGYHRAFYENKFEDAKVRGFQVLFGVRLSVWGKNRPLWGDY